MKEEIQSSNEVTRMGFGAFTYSQSILVTYDL